MSEITEIAAKARSLSRNTHDGIAIEEYLLRHLPALSSTSVAEREPVAFVSAMAIRHHIDSGTSQTGTVLHREQGELYGEKHLALYLDPPPTSELEAENARLRAERDEWAHVAGEQAKRLAEAMKVVGPFARLPDFVDRNNWDDDAVVYFKNGRSVLNTVSLGDLRAARRVREGGKVDG